MTAQAVLLVVGALAEFAGIICIGFPDLLPGGLRLSRWVRHRYRVAANRVRRILGMRPLQKIVSMSAAVEANAALSGSAVLSVKVDATIEEQVAFLLRRDEEAQMHINDHARRIVELEHETSRQLAQLREGMEVHVEERVSAAQEEYRPLRVIGTFALAIGLICTATGGLV